MRGTHPGRDAGIGAEEVPAERSGTSKTALAQRAAYAAFQQKQNNSLYMLLIIFKYIFLRI
jgi:hypothetical protein